MDKFNELIALDPYGVDLEKKNKLLIQALNESYRFQFENCVPYQKYCQKRGYSKDTTFSKYEDFPYLPVQAFKEYGEFLVTKENSDQIQKSFLLNSSATSGRPSTIFVDRATAKRQALLMTKCLSYFLGGNKVKFIVADINPKSSNNLFIGARAAATLGFLKFSSDVTYVLIENIDGGLQLDLNLLLSTLDELERSGEKFIFFGFTYVLFEAILENIGISKQYKFDSQGYLLHIGGWKKLESKKVSKRDFNKIVTSKLGINSKSIIDVYGFTEQMGVIYPSFGDNDKICSTYSTAIVRDPITFEVLPDGQEGVLQFISPLPTSYPGFSILTDDLGLICEDQLINGIYHRAFRVTGRVKNAEIRGCGDVMSTYISVDKSNLIGNSSDSELVINNLWSIDSKATTNDLINSNNNIYYPLVESLDLYIDRLKKRQLDLHKYTSDELIAYFSEASKRWIDEKSPLIKFKQEGLSFLSNWLSSNNIRSNISFSFNGQRDVLDKFKGDKTNSIRSIRAFPRGLVVHWLAGNVPLLGMLALVQSIIARNVNLLKASSHNSGVLPALLNEIAKTDIFIDGGKKIYGKDIVSAVGVIYYPKSHADAASTLSRASDLRIAWGGEEAVSAVMFLPKRHTTEDVVFGPKVSYMAIGKELLSNELNFQKLLKKVSTDCSVFDQYACASPHTIFVEKGGEISPRMFAEALAIHMEKASLRIPKNPIDGGTVGNIQSIRMLYEFTADVWMSKGTTWTVLFDDFGEKGLAKPTYSRVVTVRAISDVMKAAHFASRDIQTISLGMEQNRKIQFANIAGMLGASRFPDIGRMTHFDTPWDGLNLMQRLVRFVSIGGPST